MKTKIVISSLAAIIAIGLGIYAINGGSGNEPIVENTTKPAITELITTTIQSLKPLAKGDMAAMRILDVPVDLNQVSFVDGDGKSLTIGDWKGRVVLLNLWATWCPPCRHEMPSLEDLQGQLGGENFEVVTVSIDLKTADKPKKFFAENDLKNLNFYWDGSAKIFTSLKKQNLSFGMPTTVLINRQGIALGVLNGPAVWNGAQALALITRTLEM